MKKEILLPDHLVENLSEFPGAGGSYQIVDLKLRDGSTLKSVVVVNSSLVMVDSRIDLADIVGVEPTKKPEA